jgi:hypothetical protein
MYLMFAHSCRTNRRSMTLVGLEITGAPSTKWVTTAQSPDLAKVNPQEVASTV